MKAFSTLLIAASYASSTFFAITTHLNKKKKCLLTGNKLYSLVPTNLFDRLTSARIFCSLNPKNMSSLAV